MSDGLDPKIVKMSESLASIEDDEDDEEEDDEEETVESHSEQITPRTVDYTKRGSVIINGTEYILIQGKFEGDEYEQLMVKVESNMFFVKTPVDENVIIPFDLGIDTKAKRDESDSSMFYLNQKGQLITFQADSAQVVNDLFAKFPPDTIVEEFDHISIVTTSAESSVVSEKKEEESVIAPKEVLEKENKVTNQKDTTFDEIDIDDPDFNIDDYDMDDSGALVRKQDSEKGSAKQSAAKKESLSPSAKYNAVGRTTLSPSRHMQSSFCETSQEENIRGHSKRDIVAAKLMKPRFSVRRIKQICNWVSSLGIWHKPVTIVTLHSEFCNGVLMSKLAKKLVPSANFNFNARALTEKAAISNLELSLGVFWRSKCVNNSRIASAADIYNGNINKTVITLQEIYEVYVVQPLFAQAPKMFRWFNNILKQYNAPIPDAIFLDGDLIDLWSYVQSGFVIFCAIHHLYGPVTVGEGIDMVRIDAKRIVSKPANVNDYRENIKYLFALLKALKIPCLYELDDWLTYPDTEFIVYQLFVIYESLKSRQCSLPPAQGVNAGVSSGPNGDPIVTGMIFKDTPIRGQKASVKKKPLGVFLGGGGDSIQLLPIDTSGDSSTVYRMVCPLGLMSTKVKIVHANVKAKEEKSNIARKSWDKSVSVEFVKSSQSQRKIDILKQTHAPAPVLQTPFKSSKQADHIASSVEKLTLKDEPAKTLSSEELAKEVEKLETAMEDSQQEMEELEEELAVKYLELEQEADRLGDNEYNSRFSFLEKERTALEKERAKLQGFFAQQLNSLRVKSTVVSSPSNKSTKDKDLSFYTATTKGRASRTVEKKKTAERGWNQFVNNNESHNNVFKTKNQISSSSFLSPTKLSTYNSEKDRTMKSHKFSLEEPRKIKKTKDEVWKAFKGKLREANKQWMTSKSHRRGNKIQELMTPKAPLEMKRQIDFNSVPKIQVQRKLDDIVLEPGTPAYIRKRELELMKIEEARRWMVIQREEEMEAINVGNLRQDDPPPPPPLSPPNSKTPARMSYANKHDTPLLQSNASPISKRQTPGSQTPFSSKNMPFFSPSPFASTPVNTVQSTRNISSDQDFEAMLSWLAFPRIMSLKDRNSKEDFQWTIEEEKTKHSDYFVIKWYRIESASQERHMMKASTGHPRKELLEGFVNCQDIISAKTLSKAPTQLVLRLSSSPRSLKSSGGRTVMTIIFSTAAECSKYCDGLNELLPSSE